jgi:hypothetical protein
MANMNRTRTLTLSALLVPALSAAIAPADTLAYAPATGTRLARAWTVKQEMTLDDMQMTMNGQPFPMDLQMDMSTTMENDIQVTDVIGALREGAPAEVRRTFDKLATNGDFSMEMAVMPDGGMESTITGSSKLEGKTVTFTWNEETKEYDVAYHESEGDAELLTT